MNSALASPAVIGRESALRSTWVGAREHRVLSKKSLNDLPVQTVSLH